MDEVGVRRESFRKEEKRGRRESLGQDSERKLYMKPEMSVEKCKEEIAFYSAQTEKFFVEERGLLSGGLNPKVACEVAFINDADVEDLFGKCTKFRTTNSALKPAARKELMDLYSKIYGSTSVTNNEFAGWLVKGYIAQLKKKKVNWALAASTTACEKADRAQRLLLRLQNTDCSDDGTPSGLKHSTCTSQRDGSGWCSAGVLVKTEGGHKRADSSPSGLGVRSVCSYGVSPADLDVVRGVSEFESEILGIAMSKARFAESECKRIGDRLVGFKFTMDDRHITAKEDEEKVLQLQAECDQATKAILKLELQTSGISIEGAYLLQFKENLGSIGGADLDHKEENLGSVEGAQVDDLKEKLESTEGAQQDEFQNKLGSSEGAHHDEFIEKLGILQSNKDSLEKKLDVARSVADSSRQRAMKGKDLYQDIEEEQMRAESDLQILRREIVDMKRHAAAVEEQCVEMEKGGGLSLWPKPALHPALPNGVNVNPRTLPLHPCVFCNRGYPYFDIVVASCKHIYHIFCAAAAAEVSNRCTECDEVFHPHWWQNFGFRCAYPGLEDEILRLELPAQLEELKQSLKETGSRHIMDWTQSSLKLSDWGSSGSMPRSFHLPSGGRSTGTASVHRLPSLASNTPSEEPGNQRFGLPNSSTRGQEVQSPVKIHRIERQAIDREDVTLNAVDTEAFVAVEGEECENSKGRDSLLKRPGDLPEGHGGGRKKLALSALGEKTVEVECKLDTELESKGEEKKEDTTLNSTAEKGKGKGKCSKRKSQPSCPSADRVSTRSETKKKSKIKNCLLCKCTMPMSFLAFLIST